MWWFLLGCVGLVLASWSFFSAYRLFYPTRYAIAPPSPVPAYTTHVLTTDDGMPFDVWALEPPTPRGCILLCHGFYANRHQVLGIAEGLRVRGYASVLFELRGHGQRPGPCTLGVKETGDALRVLHWARTRHSSAILPVGVLGFSMGAAIVCQVALREPEVKAVVADSIYSQLFPIIQHAVQHEYHLPMFPWAWLTWYTLQVILRTRLAATDPVAMAPHLHQPLLAIQGGEDRRVAPSLSREFYQRWAGPKELWFAQTVGHVGMFAKNPRTYCDRVAGFFDRAFVEIT